MTARLPSASSGNGSLTLISAELQRQEESLCLMQQLKTDLHTLTTALHAALDGHAAPPLKPLTAAIYRTLLGLASLRPPQPAPKPDDPVYEIGTAVKHLEATHLDDPHDTADALTQIESASDRIDALAADFCCDGEDDTAAHPLSRAVGALLGTTPAAPRSGDDALILPRPSPRSCALRQARSGRGVCSRPRPEVGSQGWRRSWPSLQTQLIFFERIWRRHQTPAPDIATLAVVARSDVTIQKASHACS